VSVQDCSPPWSILLASNVRVAGHLPLRAVRGFHPRVDFLAKDATDGDISCRRPMREIGWLGLERGFWILVTGDESDFW
jgi:hypothetical protein